MKKIQDLTVVVWSHSTYSDVWKMFFGQIQKSAPFLKNKLLVEKEVDELKALNIDYILNEESEPFYARLINCLKKIDTEYVLYMQEDFILYDKVEKSNIENLKLLLKNENYDFVRLMKSGITDTGREVQEGIYEVTNNNSYLFSLQSTIWEKKRLIDLMNFFKPNSLVDSEVRGSSACRFLNIKGLYTYSGGEKRGSLHYDSKIFPYMATAVIGGCYGLTPRWQTSLYEKELTKLFKIYNIDPLIRGVDKQIILGE
jgi:hypothetical protein